jgi:hypothetical protein
MKRRFFLKYAILLYIKFRYLLTVFPHKEVIKKKLGASIWKAPSLINSHNFASEVFEGFTFFVAIILNGFKNNFNTLL